MESSGGELRKDLDATLQARKELGPEYEDGLVESFLEKLDGVVERRVRRQLAERQMEVARGPQGHGLGSRGGPSAASPSYPEGLGPRLWLAVTSLVLAIPLSAIAAVNTGLAGLLVCWGGIVAVNGLQASRALFARRSRRDPGADDWA
jgi:hypothetical protein